MNICNKNFKLNALALAVAGMLLSVVAHAQEDDAAAMKRPNNFVELGVSGTANNSAKFGEYNGFNKDGAHLIGNFGIRGGSAYQDNANGGTTRWSLTGTDLGLSSRTLGATYADQGAWNLGFTYDELTHNLSDSYQTPYLGEAGGNRFVLPSGFGAIVTAGNVAGSNPASPVPGTNALTASQLAGFKTVDIGTMRKNSSFNAGLSLSPRLTLNVDFNHLDQSGSKLLGFGTFGSVRPGAGSGLGVALQNVAILPMPTNYQTNTLSLALNWAGGKSYLNTSYYGSFFRNGYQSVGFETFAGANRLQNLSTAPDNDFHQFNFGAGYWLAAKTKVSGSVSYSRNTQDTAFLTPDAGVVPANALATPSSAKGLIVNTHADVKLTDQSIKDLVLSAGLKYDLRDNQTPSNVYNFISIRDTNPIYGNTPLSNRKTRLEVSGDYRIKKGQYFRLEFDREDVSRWCNQYAVAPGVPDGTNCVVAIGSKEDKLEATYRLKPSDTVDLKMGYGYSKRSSEFDPKAVASIRAGSAAAPGENAGDFLGFYPYFTASRTQHLVKASSSWQMNDQLSLGLGGRYADDAYDVVYGVQNGKSWSLNLDAGYSYSATGSVSAYVTKQHRQRDMTNLQATAAAAAAATALSRPASATWNNNLTDEDLAIGIGFKQAGLLHGKLELSGDLVYSLGETGYGTLLNYTGVTTATAGVISTCSSASILTCGDLPKVRNEMIELKLTGTYQVEKNARIMLGYVYQRLNAVDYVYNGYQYLSTPSTLLPTNQQAGAYSNSVVSVSYIRSF